MCAILHVSLILVFSISRTFYFLRPLTRESPWKNKDNKTVVDSDDSIKFELFFFLVAFLRAASRWVEQFRWNSAGKISRIYWVSRPRWAWESAICHLMRRLPLRTTRHIITLIRYTNDARTSRLTLTNPLSFYRPEAQCPNTASSAITTIIRIPILRSCTTRLWLKLHRSPHRRITTAPTWARLSPAACTWPTPHRKLTPEIPHTRWNTTWCIIPWVWFEISFLPTATNKVLLLTDKPVGIKPHKWRLLELHPQWWRLATYGHGCQWR